MFFFLLPIRTAAPIYHWPYVTVSMIVLNLVLFVLTGFGESQQIFPWSLHFGNGLIPYQWVTCNFMHLGFSHVIGNMVALWSFGLVVEGKLGWWRYLLVYLGIGILVSAILQIAMLHSEGSAAGASGIIFGLLAMTLVWAPKNEYGILFFFWFAFVVRAMVFDLSILNFSLLYLGLQLVIAIVTGFVMSSEIIHLTGAAVGLACGIILLKLDLVDCENWDVFAVLSNTHGNRVPLAGEYYQVTGTATTPVAVTSSGGVIRDIEPDSQSKLEVAEKRIHIRRKKLRRVRELLRSEKPQAALMEFEKHKVI